MQVAIAIYPRFTALDAIGPYEVLQRIPDFDVVFVGHQRGEVRTENGMLGVVADASFDEVPRPDVVVMPGGIGSRELLGDSAALDWVRRAHETSTMTTSVCSGALVLAAAGLLDGLEATTHWSVFEYLALLGAQPTSRRVVEHLDRRIITAAGVSAGIDMALRLAEILVDDVAAKAAQLFIEYDPQPPFDAGSPDKADDAVKARAAEYAATRQ